jgi:hypothetical protein
MADRTVVDSLEAKMHEASSAALSHVLDVGAANGEDPGFALGCEHAYHSADGGLHPSKTKTKTGSGTAVSDALNSVTTRSRLS